MGDPVTWLIVGATAVKAMGALQEGAAAKQAADYNAEMMTREADVERQQAGQREEAQRRKARQVLGAQRAGFAQSGTGSEGSALDVMGQSARDAELDAMTIAYEGDLRARGLESQAKITKWQGKQARKASYFKAAGTILGGGADYKASKGG